MERRTMEAMGRGLEHKLRKAFGKGPKPLQRKPPIKAKTKVSK